jgi:acyl carrier protein
MLKSDDIRSIIKNVVMGIELSDMKDDQDFADVGIDSLDQLGILLAIEEKYDIKIPDEDVEQCNSVTGIVTYVNSL